MQGVPVVALYRIEGGSHMEPSLRERYGRLYARFVGLQNSDIEMAQEVWKFFAAQQGRK